MLELLGVWILSNIPTILALGTLVGGGAYGGIKLFNKKVNDAYEKGKKEEACLVRIEGKADEALQGLSEITDKVDEEVEAARDHHQRLYDKLDKQGEQISDIRASVNYIKGAIEPKN